MNLFPALVTMPDGSVLRECRVIVNGDGTTIWAWDRRIRRPVIAASSDQPAELEGNTWSFEDDEGGTVVFIEQQGCGCSSPLKHWRTPPPVRVGR